jgi:hypothetical protein
MDSTPPPLSSSVLHTRLRSAGYELLFRSEGWVDCLVVRPGERWHGRGTTEEDALGDALQQMFPSHLARALLDAELAAEAGASASDGAALAPSAAAEASEPVPEAAAPPPSEPAAAEPAAPEPVAAPAEEPPSAPPPPAPGAPEAPAAPVAASAAPAPDVAPPGGDSTPSAAAPPREPPPSAARVRAAVEGILQEIERRMPDVAQMSAERQRLELLTWMCRARALEDTLATASDIVEVEVSRVARQLGDAARVFWPGYVGALQLNAEPDELQELRVRNAAVPKTWTAAATRAEQVLATLRAQDRVAGLDDGGWADAASLTPRPADPDAVLEEVAHELGLRLGPVGEQSEERVSQMDDAEIDALAHAAHKLRWIRGAVDAPLAWGAAIGRLRRVAHLLGQRAGTLRSALDARTRPSASWAHIVDPPPPKEERSAVLADLPANLTPPARLMAWIARAFDAMSTPEVATVLSAQHIDLAALEQAVEAQTDRRLRRRLRELVRRLGASNGNGNPPAAPAPVAPAGPPSQPDAADGAHAALTARVRARTEGRRVLFVGNREDPDLEEKLTETLGVSITWCDGSPRKVQAQKTRISKGGFDFVLCASGFQSHSIDVMLAKAAQAGRVPYIRVNRGRPLACVQAIAREFGFLKEAAAAV